MVEEAFFIKNEDDIILRKAIAKILYQNNVDQIQIAKLLDVSQPMVSNYLSSNEKIPKNISSLADEIADKLIKGENARIQTCVVFSNKPAKGKLFIADKNEIISEEKNKIINNLNEAFQILNGKDISKVLPEVKVNIAMSKPNPKASDDIASFLNGFIIADDKIIGNNGIRFGKSKHLSSLLIDLNKKMDVNSIMNIAFNKKIEKTKFKVGFLTKDFQLEEPNESYDILIHKGDFGIEPCAYILGEDAIDVSKKLLKLSDEVRK
jgi:predicted fused transcriptional regulator/phosphomethylpyrimidine kinase